MHKNYTYIFLPGGRFDLMENFATQVLGGNKYRSLCLFVPYWLGHDYVGGDCIRYYYYG
jgi:hypothetical protein